MKRKAIMGLGPRRKADAGGIPTLFFCVIPLIGIVLTGCSGAVSSQSVRQQVASLGGAELNPDDIQVQRIVDQLGGRTIAEANVRLAFQFEEDPDGEMRIVAVRLGNGNWLEVDALLAAIAAQQDDRTRDDIDKLVAGLDEYRSRNGEFPRLAAGGRISDVLHPVFMRDLVLDDAWGETIAYARTPSGFELRSTGPDRTRGTDDDIVVTDSDQVVSGVPTP